MAPQASPTSTSVQPESTTAERASVPRDCETMLWILEREWMTLDSLRTALTQWKHRHSPIGEIACRRRLMSMAQVFAVLSDQAETGERFGAIAIRRGYLSEETLVELLREQSQERPSLHTYLRDTGRLSMEEWRILERRLAQACVISQSA